ncbi:MAG: hypothetical protein MUO77_09480 [Anaerolineales bacterium]|nr:hypothetical protein [Anaerolineales bacterium]
MHQKSDSLPGLMPGIRMKGGVRYDPSIKGFVAIVHSWDNTLVVGEPKEWRTSQIFPTEEAALQYYKANIRPELEKMMSQMEKSSIKTLHRKLEE